MEDGKNPVSYGLYRVIRFFVKLFYPRTQVQGLAQLPQEPCIVVANHAQMHGPVACELYFPGKRAIWCAGQMMHWKEVPQYAYQDFWSLKPAWSRWFYKLLSYVITPFSVCVFQNAHTIGVYRDARILTTFKKTVTCLQEGVNVVIFPEHEAAYNHIVNEFQDKFIDIARLYYKKTGKCLRFVPMYIAPAHKSMYLGQAIAYDPDIPMERQRQTVSAHLMNQITALAEALPPHRVVPYQNIQIGRAHV